ncbi:retrovirus-related pol polyprotein from transposon TNT 1-94 [Tanacetum coccineum]
MNMALVLMAKAFKLNYSTPTNNNQRTSSNPRNRQIAQPGMNMGPDRLIQMVGGNGGNQFRQYAGHNAKNQIRYNAGQIAWNQDGYNAIQNNGLIVVRGIANLNVNLNGNGNVIAARAEGNGNGNNGNQIRCYKCRGLGHYARICIVRPRRRDAAYLQTQLLIAKKEEAWIQLQAEEFDLMDAAGDIDEIEEVNANCILLANLQQASTSGTQTDKAPVYDSDGTVEAKSREEVYFSNTSKTASVLNTVSKRFSIPADEFSDDTPSVARKFLNEVKDTIVTLQSVIKHRINANITNWSSLTYQEFHKIIKDEIAPIVNQVDARVQNFKNHFVKEAAKFVRDFKSLAKEADKSLNKITVLEKESERLLRAVVSLDIMSIVQRPTVVETSHIQTKLEHVSIMRTSKYGESDAYALENPTLCAGNPVKKDKSMACSSQEVSKFISRLKDQDIKSKIKIQDRKHAKGTSKEFPRTQGSKIQDVTRSEAIIPMTTP